MYNIIGSDNYEINIIYYCANNIIIDGYKIHNFDHERYIVLDYFILDLQNKKIMLYDNTITDSFIDGFENIEKIDVLNTFVGKKITIKTNESDIIILLDKDNKPIFLDEKESESRIIHTRTIDKKFIDVLNGSETKIIRI